MTPVELKTYLSSNEQALKFGNSTKHTHRPALKGFIESIFTLSYSCFYE